MMDYLNEIIKEMDIVVEKRGDGGYIAVANQLKHLKVGKNVFTYWPRSASVAIIILGLLPRKTYHDVEEMKKDQVASKIKSKYNEMVD